MHDWFAELIDNPKHYKLAIEVGIMCARIDIKQCIKILEKSSRREYFEPLEHACRLLNGEGVSKNQIVEDIAGDVINKIRREPMNSELPSLRLIRKGSRD